MAKRMGASGKSFLAATGEHAGRNLDAALRGGIHDFKSRTVPCNQAAKSGGKNVGFRKRVKSLGRTQSRSHPAGTTPFPISIHGLLTNNPDAGELLGVFGE